VSGDGVRLSVTVLGTFLAAPVGVMTLSSLIGLGRTLGLVTALRFDSALRVRASRIIFDAVSSGALIALLWSLFSEHSGLDLNNVGIVGFKLNVRYPFSLLIIPAVLTIVLSFAIPDRRAAGRIRERVSNHDFVVVARRSIFLPSKMYGHRRTFEEWVVSEAKDFVQFLLDVLFQKLWSEIRSSREQELLKLVEKRQVGAPRAERSIWGAQQGWPAQPMGAMVLLWCGGLWAMPRWWPRFGFLLTEPTIDGLGHGSAGAQPGAPAGLAGSGVTLLDLAALAVVISIVILRHPPFSVRLLIGGLGMVYGLVAAVSVATLSTVPIWKFWMPILVGAVCVRIALAKRFWIQVTEYGGDLGSNAGGIGTQVVIAVVVAGIILGVSLLTTLFASDTFGDDWTLTFSTLIRHAGYGGAYVVGLHLVVLVVTLGRVSLFDFPAVLWGAAIGFTSVIGLVVLGAIELGVGKASGHPMTSVPFAWTNAFVNEAPDRSFWWSGPVMVVWGFTLGAAIALFRAAGRWEPPDV
jgi:hypothetical protein